MSADAFLFSPAVRAARSGCRALTHPVPSGLVGCRLSGRTAGEGAEYPALEGVGRGTATGSAGLGEAIDGACFAAATAAADTVAFRLAAAADAANAKGEVGKGFAFPPLTRGVNNFPTPVSYGLGTLGVTRGFAGRGDPRAGDRAGPAGAGAASVDEGVGVPGSSGRRFRLKLTSISAAVTPCFDGEWADGMTGGTAVQGVWVVWPTDVALGHK